MSQEQGRPWEVLNILTWKKSAEKLEKPQKSSVRILRLEQKPWTGFKGGEKLTSCCLQSQGKSSVREGSGELLLHKSREQCPQLFSAVLQEQPPWKEGTGNHSHRSVELSVCLLVSMS